MLFADALGGDRFRRSVKIYATDVDSDALADARHGRYREAELVKAFGEGRTSRFFELEGDYGVFRGDLRRALTGQLDVAQRLRQREQAAARPAAGVAPPTVTLVDDASHTATVVEVRAHDAPGLLWRIGQALGECGLDLRAARVETLGAEAVDAFYVVDAAGEPVKDAGTRGKIAAEVLGALAG